MNKKITALKNYVDSSESLTASDKCKILEIINGSQPWFVKVLEVIKYIGAIAGFILAGVGANACTSFINL